jgi:hypothetical protein
MGYGSLCPKVHLAAIALLATGLLPSVTAAQPAADGPIVQRVVQQFQDEACNRCVITLNLNSGIRTVEDGTFYRAGKLVFARYDSAVLADAMMLSSKKPGVSIDRKDLFNCEQFYMASGRRPIGIHYDLVKGERKRRSVSVDPKRTYEQYFETATYHVKLSMLLSQFGPTGKSLAEITRQPSASIIAGQNSRVTATYSTEYGVVDVDLGQVGGKDVLIAARVVQSPKDVYTSLSEGRTLAELTESVVGPTPGGLTRAVYECALSHDEAQPARPFKTLTVTEFFTGAGKTWHGTHTLTLTEYRKCTSPNCVEELRVPVPDGSVVSSLDPDFHPLTLVYQDGDIVREVDGASLNDIIAGRVPARQWVYYYVATGIAVLLVAGVVVYRWRRVRPTA